MAIDFRRIVFFGDSLTDNGNLPGPVRPAPPYVGGRLTNGLVYAEVLAKELGIPTDNVAFGGAEASTDPDDDAAQQFINLSAQVEVYLAQQPFPFFGFGGRVEPGTAASLFIGSNDVINERPSNSAEAADLAERIVGSISDAVVELTDEGVSRVVLYTLPYISDTPYGRDLSASDQAAADAAVMATNRGIKALAAQSSAVVATTVVDVNRLEAEINADPATFGLKVLDKPIYNKVGSNLIATGVTAQVSANDVAFFDPLHPTKVVHAIIGAFSEATLKADRVILRGNASDSIVGTTQNDLIFAGGRADTVSSRGGNDVVFAGTGDDRVHAGGGNDLVVGGKGNDRINGSANSDLLTGNAGDDRIAGGTGADILVDGTGADELFGQSNNDVFLFRNDGLGNGLDQISGGSGTDTLRVTVSQSFFGSAAFQTELQEFRAALRASPGAAFMFDTLDLAVSSVERLEVKVGGKTAFAAGQPAVPTNQALAALAHDAGLWGIL
jgi:Ca2+-binding RTX toxin-like protein